MSLGWRGWGTVTILGSGAACFHLSPCDHLQPLSLPPGYLSSVPFLRISFFFLCVSYFHHLSGSLSFLSLWVSTSTCVPKSRSLSVCFCVSYFPSLTPSPCLSLCYYFHLSCCLSLPLPPPQFLSVFSVSLLDPVASKGRLWSQGAQHSISFLHPASPSVLSTSLPAQSSQPSSEQGLQSDVAASPPGHTSSFYCI